MFSKQFRTTIIDLIAKWGNLFLISASGLFIELSIIRWLSGEVRLLAYFKNVTLLAAFLGFSIGFALVNRSREYRYSFPILWGLFTIVVIGVGLQTRGRSLVYPGFDELLFFFSVPAELWLELLVFLGQIALFFLMTLLLFIPVGQATGEEMALLPPVKAYAVNILASIAGTWLFALLSYLETAPIIWFSIALAGLMIFYKSKNKLNWKTVAIFFITLVGIGMVDREAMWSPYNRLNITEATRTGTNGQAVKIGYDLDVQFTTYMDAFDLSEKGLQFYKDAGVDTDELEKAANTYDMPYKLAPEGSQVLILGSGMGNDVAGALRNHMGTIDAVEIDPVILHLGETYHPEKPYSYIRVNKLIDDARSFLKKTKKQYDVISFALLDSHTLLSSMSSVRIDSYVYTVESFEEVKKHLAADGIVVVNFASTDWISERLGRMMARVFGADQIHIIDTYYKHTGKIFVAGNLTDEQIQLSGARSWAPDPKYDDVPLTTDDWPNFYLRDRTIPTSYWEAIIVIAIISLFITRRSFPEVLSPDWHFWFLGAAFLLIEFKNISELALLFGTTWFVNTLAISGVLLMALGANLFVQIASKINLRWIYGLLFASLLIGFLFPLQSLGALNPVAKSIIGTTILCLPIFFAGIIFSESLKQAGETAGPIASNFSGSAAGGLLEYSSMIWGIKSLHILSTLLYAGAAIFAFGKKRKGNS